MLECFISQNFYIYLIIFVLCSIVSVFKSRNKTQLVAEWHDTLQTRQILHRTCPSRSKNCHTWPQTPGVQKVGGDIELSQEEEEKEKTKAVELRHKGTQEDDLVSTTIM